MNSVLDLFHNPDEDLDKMKLALEAILDCDEPDRIAVLMMPVIAAICLKVYNGPNQINSDQLGPSAIMNLMSFSINEYMVGLADSVGGSVPPDEMISEANYAAMSMSMFMQMVVHQKDPESFDVSQLTASFIDELHSEIIKRMETN
tara:strand:+ start:8545 stop:8982 length:438 start_codon:yes stop_codon:yes gene_type:complete